jgi:hypothetical protein
VPFRSIRHSPREAREQPVHIIRRGLAVREQDAVADRGDQDVDRVVNRKCGLAALEGAGLEGLQVMGRVSATARGGDFGIGLGQHVAHQRPAHGRAHFLRVLQDESAQVAGSEPVSSGSAMGRSRSAAVSASSCARSPQRR